MGGGGGAVLAGLCCVGVCTGEAADVTPQGIVVAGGGGEGGFTGGNSLTLTVL